jgi:hypothetical protein
MRRRHKFFLWAVLLLTQFLWGAPFADASVVYTYTGKDFQECCVDTPYTTSDSVTGSITLSSALGDNLSGQMLSIGTGVDPIISFSFSDGEQTISTTNFSSELFYFSTGSTGSISQWYVLLTDPNGFIATFDFYGMVYDQGLLDNPPYPGGFTSVPGSWSTPLPATFPLFATSLGGLGLLGWLRRRKLQAVAV